MTATPFANIFINPFDEQGMFNDDLFPKDFIFALDVPTNYIGAEKIFGGKYKNFLVPLKPDSCPDAELYFPKNHRITLKVKRLPESLCAAMDYFLLANAVRDLRGETKSHRTMLIHVSRFKSVHAQLYDLINTRLNEIVNALRAYSQLPAAEAERESPYLSYSRLKRRELHEKVGSQATLILKGLSKSPIHSCSKLRFCLLFRKIFAAPFTSALISLPLFVLYKPRLIRLPLNVPA